MTEKKEKNNEAQANKVDFSYSFAPPHRMTLCMPESSDKTLVDVEPGKLMLSWSYEKLSDFPKNIWKTPHIDWKVEITPMVDGKPFKTSLWGRAEDGIPDLVNTYEEDSVKCTLEVIGASTAMLMRVTFANRSTEQRQCLITCEHKGGWIISNPAWIDGSNPNTLMAMEFERPDRILVLGIGAEDYPVRNEIIQEDGVLVPLSKSFSEQTDINYQKTMTLLWNLEPKQKKSGWIIRPYTAYQADLPVLMGLNWELEYENAKTQWLRLLKRAVQVRIPDTGVMKGFNACLSDLFVMREPLKNEYIGEICGTEVYRSSNSFEPCITSILLDQMGLHTEAAEGLRIHLDSQGYDGNWADPQGWGHHMWGASGMKAWGVMEHYKLTGDRDFLADVYPRMKASSIWQEQQRAKTRIEENGQRSSTYGLMPRGMGDGGLINGVDYFGVYYPHNFLAVYGDRLSVEAAGVLGKNEDLPELNRIYETGLTDLKASLEIGAIQESDYRWIPGTPGKVSGSRWGALLSLYPCGILSENDPLIEGTLKHIEMNISPGGHPIGTGWMQDGSWVAISLDNIAETYLALGNGDAASRYLYPTLNHGTPLYTWCEERGTDAGTKKTSGDLQHLWTPLAVCRYIRDALVMEQKDGLMFALGTPREWLSTGKPLSIINAPTHFGHVSYNMQYEPVKGKVTGSLSLSANQSLKWVVLNIRLPGGKRVVSINVEANAKILENGEGIRWENPKGGEYTLEIDIC